jgi:hypothetical protein
MDNNQQPAVRDERRHWNTGSLWVGVMFIMVGIFFILRIFGVVSLHNWWALFILIPAAGSFGAAFTTWRRKGRFTRSVAGSIGGGLIITAVALIFLFGLHWGRVWPVFIVLAGLSMLISAFASHDRALPGSEKDEAKR